MYTLANITGGVRFCKIEMFELKSESNNCGTCWNVDLFWEVVPTGPTAVSNRSGTENVIKLTYSSWYFIMSNYAWYSAEV